MYFCFICVWGEHALFDMLRPEGNFVESQGSNSDGQAWQQEALPAELFAVYILFLYMGEVIFIRG